MKIVLACKHNVARSYCAERILQPLFPDFEIRSAGIETTSQQIVYPWRVRFLDELGIASDEAKSTPIENLLHEISPTDFVIASDSEVSKGLISRGVSSAQIYSIDKIGIQKIFIPRNPNIFQPYEIMIECIKAILCYKAAIEKLLGTQTEPDQNRIVYDLEGNLNFKFSDFATQELRLGRSVLAVSPYRIPESMVDLVSGFESLDNLLFSSEPRIHLPRYEDSQLMQSLVSRTILQKVRQFGNNEHRVAIWGGQLRSGNEISRTNLLTAMLTSNWEFV